MEYPVFGICQIRKFKEYNFLQTEEYLYALSFWLNAFLELTHEQFPPNQRMPFTSFLPLSNLLKMSAFWVPRVNFCMVLDICNMD